MGPKLLECVDLYILRVPPATSGKVIMIKVHLLRLSKTMAIVLAVDIS